MNNSLTQAEARIAALESALRDQRLWIARRLEMLVYVPTTDFRGHVRNGFAASQVPEWELKQKLEHVDAALSPAPEPPKTEVKP